LAIPVLSESNRNLWLLSRQTANSEKSKQKRGVTSKLERAKGCGESFKNTNFIKDLNKRYFIKIPELLPTLYLNFKINRM
jgi:hypothetical protein